MAFYAELLIDGKKFKVLEYEFEFSQTVDAYHHKPSTKPHGGILEVTVESQDGDDLLLAWMLSNTMTKGGTLIAYAQDSPIPLKTIAFSTAYCIEYEEEFNHEDEENLKISFKLTCKKVTVNGQSFTNSWS